MKPDANQIKEITMMSIFEVFEKMYYIFLEPSDYASSAELKRLVEIGFSGVVNGEMQAYISENLAETMIENALGMEQKEITEQILEDCLKECINMICGNFVQKLEPDRVLQLSIPRYSGKVNVPGNVDAPETMHFAFESEGVTMNVILKLGST